MNRSIVNRSGVLKRSVRLNRSLISRFVLSGGLIISLAGCSSLSPQRPSAQQGFGGPASMQQHPMQNPAAARSMPLTANGMPAMQPGMQSGGMSAAPAGVAQVGWIGDRGRGIVQHSNCGCGACSSSASSSGCQSGNCLTGNCAPGSPCGMPAAINAYAVDGQEYLCDGGDNNPPVRIRRDNQMVGLQPEDTVVNYTTQDGDLEIQASNKVCVYSPRFASVRKITGAVSGGRAVGLSGIAKPVGPGRFDYNQGGVIVSDATELGHADVARRIDAMRDRNRGVPVENVQQVNLAADVLEALAGLTVLRLDVMEDAEKANLEKAAQFAVAWTLDEALEVSIQDVKALTLTRDQKLEAFTIYEFPDAGRLKIVKLADRQHAQPGEIVEFAIRVDNVGDSPVTEVTLTDNLTTRLEFVEGSETSSADASFVATPNNGQSLRLQWTLSKELKVGESATVRFRCRVR